MGNVARLDAEMQAQKDFIKGSLADDLKVVYDGQEYVSIGVGGDFVTDYDFILYDLLKKGDVDMLDEFIQELSEVCYKDGQKNEQVSSIDDFCSDYVYGSYETMENE
ncbi:hypothetical protein J2Z60_001814 [Lactobacillus colini]|uniref:Uncharacterized protein n=1 Tax=Lactobacillus colini TaxID=1819254 RepID=A0ABS4MG07_9LACO|nr:hypothetical protein [Lactobacillus colini]MBP2058626.1 hypothetical protein [Lactobacillus colini]